MSAPVTTRQSLASFQRAAELAGNKRLELHNEGTENEWLTHPKWHERPVQFIRSILEKLAILRPDPDRAMRQQAAKTTLFRLLDAAGTGPSVSELMLPGKTQGITGRKVLDLLARAAQSAGRDSRVEPETGEDYSAQSAGRDSRAEPETGEDYSAQSADRDSLAEPETREDYFQRLAAARYDIADPGDGKEGYLTKRDVMMMEKLPREVREQYEKVQRRANGPVSALLDRVKQEHTDATMPQQGAPVYENAARPDAQPQRLYENTPSATDEVHEDVQPQAEEVYEDMRPQAEEVYEDVRTQAEEVYEDVRPQAEEVYEDVRPQAEEVYDDTLAATRKPDSPLPGLPQESGQDSGAGDQVYATVLPGTRDLDSPLPELPQEAGRREAAGAGDKTDVRALFRKVKGLRGEVRKQVQKEVAAGTVSGRGELTRLINEKTATWVENNRVEQWYREGLAEARKAGAPVSNLESTPPDELFEKIGELIQSHDGVFAYDDIKSAARETVRAHLYGAVAGDTLLPQELKGVRAEVQAEMKQLMAGGNASGRARLTRLTNEKTAAWVQNNRVGQWYAEGLDNAGRSAPRQGTVPADLVGMIMDSIENHDGLYGYEDVKSGARRIIRDYLQSAPAGR